MNILITGGAGFIGYHLAKQFLADQGHHLVLIDNLQRGKIDDDFKNLLTDPRVQFTPADLTDQKFYKTLPINFDQVYHLAAVNGTKLFYQIPEEVLRINTLSLVYILEWIRGLSKKPKFCFPSSSEVYAGALGAFGRLPIPTPEKVPLVIEDPYNPRASYDVTKLLGESFVIHYASTYHFPAVIIRPHNFYGPRAGYDHVIPEFCLRIIERVDPFPIYGADNTRTFCYIDDVVRAMQMLMASPHTDTQPVQTVHLGASEEITMQQLAERLFAAIGWKPQKLNIQNAPAGSVKRRLADISKIKDLVGWEPETSLDDGLKATFAWYKLHPKK